MFQIKGFKSTSPPQQEAKDDSLIDLECVICQSIPESDKGNLHIFSCQQHHLLCQTCLRRVNKCPICKQDFGYISCTRNFLAERIALQMNSNNPTKSFQPKKGFQLFNLYFYAKLFSFFLNVVSQI